MRISFAMCLAVGAAALGTGCTIVATQTPANGQTTVAAPRVFEAPEGDLIPIDKWSTTLVTARSVPKVGDVREISDKFTFEGRVFAHATLTSVPGSNGGHPAIEMRWYNGDKLVAVRKMEPNITSSPYYLVASTSGTAIGVGEAHVELLADGKLMASKAFQVSER